VGLSALLCSSQVDAKELPADNTSFVDEQLKILENGASLQLGAFSFFQDNGQQSLFDTRLIEKALGNLDKAQDARIENIDRMHASMEGTLVHKRNLEKLSAILNVKSDILLKFVEHNPGFGPQFHELLLVLETGSGPQGPQFNQSIVANLKENISAWLDRHFTDDHTTTGELQKITKFLANESDGRILDFNAQQSEKLLAMLEADQFWNSKVAYIPDSGEFVVPNSFTTDAAGNSIPIVLASPLLPNAESANKAALSLDKTEAGQDASASMIADQAVPIFQNQESETSGQATSAINGNANTQEAQSYQPIGFSHYIPKIHNPNYTEARDRPTDVFSKINANSSRVPHNNQESGDLCARFGIDCPQTALSNNYGPEFAEYANMENFYRNFSNTNSKPNVEIEPELAPIRMADLNSSIRKKSSSSDTGDEEGEETAVTHVAGRSPSSTKKPTKAEAEAKAKAEANKNKEEIRPAIVVDQNSNAQTSSSATAKPDAAQTQTTEQAASDDKKTGSNSDSTPPTPTPEAPKDVAKTPAAVTPALVKKTPDLSPIPKTEAKADAEKTPALSAAAPTQDLEQKPIAPTLPEISMPADISKGNPQFQIKSTEKCNEKEAQQKIASLYKVKKSAAKGHAPLSEEIYWSSFFRYQLDKVKGQRTVTAVHCAVRDKLKPGCADTDKELENVIATLHLATTLTASDTPACDLIQGKLNTQNEKNEKYCFNLQDQKHLNPEFSKIVSNLLSQSMDELSRVMESGSPTIQALIQSECAQPKSYLAKSLCMNKLLNRVNTDFLVKGREKKENSSFFLDQVKNCTQPGQLGHLVHKRELELREIARQCGSWEARLVSKIAPTNKGEVSKLNEALNLVPSLAQFMTVNHYSLLESSEKSVVGFGENTLPFSKTDARFSPLIETDPKAPQSKAVYSIYNYMEPSVSTPETSFSRDRKLGRLEKLMSDLASSSQTDFKLRSDLKAILSKLQQDHSLEEHERDLRIQCHQYILPRYSYIVGTILHARHVSIANNGNITYPGVVVEKSDQPAEIRRSLVPSAIEIEHTATERKPAGDLSFLAIPTDKNP
jgi:hypothetical protein